MGGAVAIILIKERHIVDAFERAGATSPERALNPADAGVDNVGIGWRRLRERAIVREAGPGRFYLDVEVWQATRRTRRRVLVALVAILLLVAVFLAGTTGTFASAQ
jgi:hypothetical protein